MVCPGTNRQACGQRGVSADIHAGCAGGQDGADDDIVNLFALNAGPLHRMRDGVSHEGGRLDVVQGTTEGPTNGRAGG